MAHESSSEEMQRLVADFSLRVAKARIEIHDMLAALLQASASDAEHGGGGGHGHDGHGHGAHAAYEFYKVTVYHFIIDVFNLVSSRLSSSASASFALLLLESSLVSSHGLCAVRRPLLTQECADTRARNQYHPRHVLAHRPAPRTRPVSEGENAAGSRDHAGNGFHGCVRHFRNASWHPWHLEHHQDPLHCRGALMAGIRAVAPLFSSSRSHAMPGADTGYAAARYTEVHHMEKEYKTWEVSADARVVRCLQSFAVLPDDDVSMHGSVLCPYARAKRCPVLTTLTPLPVNGSFSSLVREGCSTPYPPMPVPRVLVSSYACATRSPVLTLVRSYACATRSPVLTCAMLLPGPSARWLPSATLGRPGADSDPANSNSTPPEMSEQPGIRNADSVRLISQRNSLRARYALPGTDIQ
eukprot:2317377-Rhodomonas_salina.1